MDLKLKGQTAFISGSTGGIGFAVAKTLLAEGAKVYINGRSQESVDRAIAGLLKFNPNGFVEGIAADFSKVKEVDALIKALPSLDILINNVGIFYSKSFGNSHDDDWYKQFEVNVMSGVRLARHFLPKMLRVNYGRILFVSSECASLVPADLISYSMTKAGVLAVSRGLAQLTKGTQVTVNTVVPGSTLTQGAENFLNGVAQHSGKTREEVEKEFFTEVRSSSLLQRFAKVEEVANTMAYIASPLSSATNGATINIDGGSIGGIV